MRNGDGKGFQLRGLDIDIDPGRAHFGENECEEQTD
jgi:hypothetical protein